MSRTHLAYQYDGHLTTLQTSITAVKPLGSLDEANRSLFKNGTDDGYVIVTESTIFHPQGGGQPSDEGTMQCDDNGAIFQVSSAKMSANGEGQVYHYGHFTNGSDFALAPGAHVTQQLDVEKRVLYSRYHTAGHVLGAAVRHLCEKEVPNFDELKASHFPDSAACEFQGSIEGKWKEVIQKKVDEYIDRNMRVEIDWWDEADFRANGLERLIMDRKAMGMADDEKFRVVRIVGAETYPCGGTHVDSTQLCGKTNVKKISRSKGNSRVSYVLP